MKRRSFMSLVAVSVGLAVLEESPKLMARTPGKSKVLTNKINMNKFLKNSTYGQYGFTRGESQVCVALDEFGVSLPPLNFSMQLISPYGNTIPQLQNRYIT